MLSEFRSTETFRQVEQGKTCRILLDYTPLVVELTAPIKRDSVAHEYIIHCRI